MLVGEFMKNATRHIKNAVTAGEPLEIEHYRKPYAVVVPVELWRQAQEAMAAEARRQAKKQRRQRRREQEQAMAS